MTHAGTCRVCGVTLANRPFGYVHDWSNSLSRVFDEHPPHCATPCEDVMAEPDHVALLMGLLRNAVQAGLDSGLEPEDIYEMAQDIGAQAKPEAPKQAERRLNQESAQANAEDQTRR